MSWTPESTTYFSIPGRPGESARPPFIGWLLLVASKAKFLPPTSREDFRERARKKRQLYHIVIPAQTDFADPPGILPPTNRGS